MIIMENKVIISLEEYNELLNFKAEILNGKTFVLGEESRVLTDHYETLYFYTDKQVAEKIKEWYQKELDNTNEMYESRLQEYLNKNNNLKKEVFNLKCTIDKLQNKLTEIKKMTWREFKRLVKQ